MLAKIEAYRKFVVALVGSVAGIWIVVAAADLSTREGIYAMIPALITAAGVYKVPNKP